MGCSTSFAKIILFVFNAIFFLLGIGSLILGIWVLTGKSKLFEFVSLIDSKVADGANQSEIDAAAGQGGLLLVAAVVLIIVGSFTLIVGFCGCCGALKESPVLLTIYAALIGLVLIVEIVAAILAAVFKNSIQSNAKQEISKLQEKYFIPLEDYIDSGNSSKASAAVTYLLNFAQISFSCCGAVSVNDISNSASWTSANPQWKNKAQKTAITCCKLKNPNDKNTILNPGFNWSNFDDYLENSNCPYEENSTSIYDQTCDAGVVNLVSTFSTPIIGVCVAIALIELLGITISCCLINAIRNN